MKPTDEQLRDIWRAGIEAGNAPSLSQRFIECGRAVFVQSCRVALDVPTRQECEDALYMQGQKKDAHTILRSFTANRLRLLTAPIKDDAAIALEREFMRQSGRPDNPWDFAKMVEAVRKADAQ